MARFRWSLNIVKNWTMFDAGNTAREPTTGVLVTAAFGTCLHFLVVGHSGNRARLADRTVASAVAGSGQNRNTVS